MSCTSCTRTPPPHLQRAAEEIFNRAKLTDALQHVAELNRSLEAGYRELAADERAAALGLPSGGSRHETLFALARQHASAARESFRQTLDAEPWLEARQVVDTAGNEFSRSVSNMREIWAGGLGRAEGISGPDAQELMTIFDLVGRTVQSGGIESLQGLFDEQLSQFDDILRPDRDWGREPHSPLEWWKWLIIIAILVIAIAALIVCFWWFGCSWIYAIFVGVCAGALATGGWTAGLCVTVLF